MNLLLVGEQRLLKQDPLPLFCFYPSSPHISHLSIDTGLQSRFQLELQKAVAFPFKDPYIHPFVTTTTAPGALAQRHATAKRPPNIDEMP